MAAKLTSRAVKVTAWTLCLLLVTCQQGARPEATSPPALDKQFALQHLSFEERRNGAVLWRGEGDAANGDVGRSRLQNMTLRRQPQHLGEQPLTIWAPLGDLQFAAGAATFTAPVVQQSSGAKLFASRAYYNEEAATLEGHGPVAIWTPSCVTYASGCKVHLRCNVVQIEGPVEGIFTHVPRQP